MSEAIKLWVENSKKWMEEINLCIAGNDLEILTIDKHIEILNKRKALIQEQSELHRQSMAAQQLLIDDAVKQD